MLLARPIVCLSCLGIALVLGGCAQSQPKNDAPLLEQRLLDIERRVESLEARSEVEPPYRSKAEIQAHIKTLEEERGKLLVSYTAQHPAIRDIDRRLRVLNDQLKMLE